MNRLDNREHEKNIPLIKRPGYKLFHNRQYSLEFQHNPYSSRYSLDNKENINPYFKPTPDLITNNRFSNPFNNPVQAVPTSRFSQKLEKLELQLASHSKAMKKIDIPDTLFL